MAGECFVVESGAWPRGLLTGSHLRLSATRSVRSSMVLSAFIWLPSYGCRGTYRQQEPASECS